jgi:hypothetical protein
MWPPTMRAASYASAMRVIQARSVKWSAYTWLQCERHRRGTHLPTLPMVRAVITEILTAHFFVTRPHYLRTMQKLVEIDLRI